MSKKPIEPVVTPELAAEHGMSADEFARLRDSLGREPTYTELGVASVMWSEHCSYKSSRVHLKTLPTEGPKVICGPGENAGVVDIGDGQAVIFKMESHNHPSFIEPYQGAATGVGGICRDVFTMGARPVALADCLRFGRPDHPKTHHLVDGVVAGIAGYGNSFGVPNVTGDVLFDASYDGNILVNAFCLGVAETDKIFYANASGIGNPVIYVGAKTGRDGIHGATMASAEFAEDAEAKRPTVQVGDPFMEKLLLEACLELMQTDCLVGIQDMGAAGLTSSSVEMAARAGSGIELDLEKVPQREANMTAYELMLSESQERMLMVVHKGREQEALDVFAKWDLDAAVVGRVTDSGRVIVRMNGDVCADLPAELLAEGLKYDRPRERPGYLDRVAVQAPLAAPEDWGSALVEIMGAPNVASKAWVWRQYDHNVRHGTVARPGQADAGVVRVVSPDGARVKGVAIAAGCDARKVYLAPFEGAQLVVAECYAKLVASGAAPLAITDCLNFGNPENPGIMWQFAEAVRGLGEACKVLDTPVVSGNVSLYNETDGVAIKPTPMVAMVGLLDDLDSHTGSHFRRPGDGVADRVAVIGALGGSLAGSEYQSVRGPVSGVPAFFDPATHKPVFEAVLKLNRAGLLASCHNVAEGGLAAALAEACVGSDVPVGAEVSVPGAGDADEVAELLFGEGPARFVVSYAAADADKVRDALGSVSFAEIGSVGGDRLRIDAGAARLDVPLADLSEAWSTGFAKAVA